VIDEIAADMAQDRPMIRLLQGDVGSGKTVAAVYAMLLCVAHRHQAVLMAPTEILARQHSQTFAAALRASRVRWTTLTGGTTDKQRREVLQQIAAGELDLVIGTHALLQEDVKFKNLGLVVIDEQHKFGVRQRAALRGAGGSPHYLVMTATPIPRTLTMALFGDLDVSTLREMPPGRQPVNTYVVEPEKRSTWWQFVRDQLTSGRQAYVVSPLVDESDNVAAASAEQTFEALANGELEAFRLGLIHGRMTSREKDAAMQAFRAGRTQGLVSTSVIEVGVDVPNATVLTVLSPDRFGLAQLHQLRGRVCRGEHPGFCGLLTDEIEEEETGDRRLEIEESSASGRREPAETEINPRLDAFAKLTDGFELAEIDFHLRGPGDLLNTQQHGLPPLRIADLRRDAAIVEEARREAQKLVTVDPGLDSDVHARLRKMVLLRYGKALDLGDVG
jgi:ATP-dependent DNA helicase RecG